MSHDPDYPLPSHAISIWLSGNDLMLGLSPLDGNSKGHILRIAAEKLGVEVSAFGEPLASQRGWAALLSVLRERNKAGRQPLGSAGEPTQYNLDAMLRSMKKFDTKGREKVDAEDLGL